VNIYSLLVYIENNGDESPKDQPDALISQIYFGRKLYMFRTVPLSIIRSFSLYTQQWYRSYRFFWQLASRIKMILLALAASAGW